MTILKINVSTKTNSFFIQCELIRAINRLFPFPGAQGGTSHRSFYSPAWNSILTAPWRRHGLEAKVAITSQRSHWDILLPAAWSMESLYGITTTGAAVKSLPCSGVDSSALLSVINSSFFFQCLSAEAV